MKTKKQTILLIETRKQKGNEKDATLGPRPLKKTLSLMKKIVKASTYLHSFGEIFPARKKLKRTTENQKNRETTVRCTLHKISSEHCQNLRCK